MHRILPSTVRDGCHYHIDVTGISAIHDAYPLVRIVTAEIDAGLNEQVLMVASSGLGRMKLI